MKHEKLSRPRSSYALTCKTCGKETNRTMDHECVDCYLSSHLPSKVSDDPWVWALGFRPTPTSEHEEPDPETISLGRAIINGKVETVSDGQVLRIWLDENNHHDVPLTTGALDSLAQRTRIRLGKWLVYRSRSEIDKAWKLIAKSVFDKALGSSAKVSTAAEASSERRHVICVYTRNYLNLEDVGRVRRLLGDMGFTEPLCYKPDIYTYLNIYSGTTKLSPCRYRE